MQDLSYYDSNNLAYILNMDSLALSSCSPDHNQSANPPPSSSHRDYLESLYDSRNNFSDGPLMKAQVVRRRNHGANSRKRLSLNLSNLPEPIIDMSSRQSRRLNRLSLPQRLADLEIDVSPARKEERPKTKPTKWEDIGNTASPPASRITRHRTKTSALASRSPEIPKFKHKDLPIVPTERPLSSKAPSPKPPETVVKLRNKAGLKAPDKRRNADFRLSFEMDI